MRHHARTQRRATSPRGGRGRLVATALLALVALVGACTAPSRPASVTASSARGGTLHVLLDAAVEHWDPQRIYSGPEASLAGRMFLRTLTAQPAGGSGVGLGLVPDLATTTGTASDGGRTWTFTLVRDAKWQDGRTVTCEDVKYGISRNFARDVLPGGPPYAASLLDIPLTTSASGAVVPAYTGPYTGTGQASYDKAVTCAGQVLTFHLKVPAQDFNQTVSLASFAPVRKDQDKRGDGNFSVFSNGPYMLEGAWDPGSGGRFVRTRSWTTLSDPLRAALPEVIEIQEGLETTTAIQRIIDDKGEDRYAVTLADAPPALQQQLLSTDSLRSRVTNPPAPTVEYLVPNTRSPVMKNAKARQALAMATDRDAFVNAYGGTTAMTPTYALLASTVPGATDPNPFGVGTAGDPAAARAVLEASGLTLPVPVTVAYRQSDVADTAFASLKAGWERAGFVVTLAPITTDYYATIGSPAAATKYDVFRASWSADWPSGSTVIPSTFDSRVNVTAAGPGQDYGYFSDAGVNAAIDAAYGVSDPTARNAAWAAIDARIAKLGGHIALAQQKYVFVHGSGVEGYEDNLLLGGHVDLARIQLAK